MSSSTFVKRCSPQARSTVTRTLERGDYLRIVEALQGSLLAGNCAISTMRFEEASVEESSECCETTGDCELRGPRDDRKRKSGSKRNEDKECKKNPDVLEARSLTM